MAGSDVVQAMRLALKPFNIQHCRAYISSLVTE